MKFSLDMDISDLKKISFASNKPKKIKYPTKRTINLAMKDDNSKRRGFIIGGIALAVIVLAVGVKIGIVDLYAKLNAVQEEYDLVYAQRVALEEKVSRYDDVEQEYRSYSRDWMTEDTSGKYVSIDRLDVLDMLERVVFYEGTVENFACHQSTVTLDMSGMSLQEISVMFEALQEEPLVQSAVLNVASTSDTDNVDAETFNLTIQLVPVAEEEEAAE